MISLTTRSKTVAPMI